MSMSFFCKVKEKWKEKNEMKNYLAFYSLHFVSM